MTRYGNLIHRIERAAEEGRELRLRAEDVDLLATILHTLDAATEAAHYDELDAAPPGRHP